MRRIAAPNARSAASANRCASCDSRANACTVWIAPSRSPASALVSATRSWLARESRRTRRPNTRIGSITSRIIPTIIDASDGLVTSIITRLPANSSELRRPIEMLVPTSVWISVVSVVSRESTSPGRRVSKKRGS